MGLTLINRPRFVHDLRTNLQTVLNRRVSERSRDIEALFARYGVLEIHAVKSVASDEGLGTTEIALVAICCCIFFGVLLAIVVICISWKECVFFSELG